MKKISEQELDKLISDSFGRNNVLNEINAGVMATLKSEHRRARLLQLRHLAGVCLCFALGLTMPVAAVYFFSQAVDSLLQVAPMAAGMLAVLAILIVELNRLMKDFSFRSL